MGTGPSVGGFCARQVRFSVKWHVQWEKKERMNKNKLFEGRAWSPTPTVPLVPLSLTYGTSPMSRPHGGGGRQSVLLRWEASTST